jgi:hypothetical protein
VQDSYPGQLTSPTTFQQPRARPYDSHDARVHLILLDLQNHTLQPADELVQPPRLSILH